MRVITSLTTLLMAFILAGCAAQFNPVGETKFDCNRKQDAQSPYCRSFKSLEKSTAGALPPSRFDREFNIDEFDALTGIAPERSAQGQNPKTKSAAQPLPPAPARLPHQMRDDPPLEGQPIRQGPVVQRVWIKRFVDGRDVLTENTVVYKEIQGNRWAGFDARPADDLPKAMAYPHRAVEPAKEPVSEVKQAADTSNSPKPPPAPEFKQPGQPLAGESVPEPAASGSMPN